MPTGVNIYTYHIYSIAMPVFVLTHLP